MRISDAYPSNYLKAADLQGRTAVVVISHCDIEEIGDERKPILYFQGKKKGMVLNKTNANNVSVLYGDDTDDWTGQPVELFEAMVEFQGKTVPALRIRRPKAVKAAAPKPNAQLNGQPVYTELSPPPRTDLDDDIPF